MRRELLPQDVEFAVKGGSVYGCGGGGFADHGRTLGNLATSIGRPELVSVDELDPDALVATMAAIGAPGGLTHWEMRGVDYLRAVELLREASDRPIVGLMIGQNGMSSTLNAWLPGAVLGLAVVDAVGDLRAHPTGDMGSLGLANSPEPMIQTAAGGNRDRGAYLEIVVRGPTARVSPALRTAANEAGGFIASCRNAIPVRMVAERAVLGGISQALNVGRAIVRAEPQGADAVIAAICEATGGTIIASGTVTRAGLAYTREAFDCGRIEIATARRTHRRARAERVHGAGARRCTNRHLSRCDHDADAGGRPGQRRSPGRGRAGADPACAQGADSAVSELSRSVRLPAGREGARH